MKRPVRAVLGCLLGALGLMSLAGCGNGPADSKGKVRAVCTVGMVADLVRNVGGSHVEVTQLMGEGVDPHRYEVRTGDVTRLEAADIIFYSGLHLEGKMADLFERLGKRRPTVAVAEGIDRKHVLKDDEETDDPHLWFDVSLWSEGVNVVRDALVKHDPKHADDYKANAAAYRARLAELHEYVKKQIASIPREQRVLVTSHDAFRYFQRAYDIEVKGIQGISTADEAGLKDIEELADFLTRRKIKAVFVETSVSDRPMKALIAGCAARGHKVVIGGQLFSDAMGKEGTEQGTYIGMVRHNVDTIVKGLR